MTDERMNEITQYAQERLRTGDILAAYALEVIDFAHEAVEARKQAGHSAAELMKLLSQTEKERDEARAEVELLRAEVRKQVFSSRVVFDREVVERAQNALEAALKEEG